jgi:dTDP-4-amino-4,6-dideoxygalactose transaminase
MTEMQAAMGVVQLGKLDRILGAKRRSAEVYERLLRGSPVGAPQTRSGAVHTWQTYLVTLPVDTEEERDAVVDRLRERGVEASFGTCHLPLASYYRKRYGCREGDYPVTDRVFARTLAIPLFEGITEEQQETVVRELLACL